MTEGRPWIVLDRVEDEQPPYCIHGEATCLGCGHRVWLGSETYPRVASGAVRPVCMACARLGARLEDRTGNIADHRRADGPHL